MREEKLRDELRRIIFGHPFPSYDHRNSDNIAIALASYAEGLPDCPDDDVDDETGWSQWATDAEEKAESEITDKIIELWRSER